MSPYHVVHGWADSNPTRSSGCGAKNTAVNGNVTHHITVPLHSTTWTRYHPWCAAVPPLWISPAGGLPLWETEPVADSWGPSKFVAKPPCVV